MSEIRLQHVLELVNELRIFVKTYFYSAQHPLAGKSAKAPKKAIKLRVILLDEFLSDDPFFGNLNQGFDGHFKRAIDSCLSRLTTQPREQ